jgi:hypothetical protein
MAKRHNDFVGEELCNDDCQVSAEVDSVKLDDERLTKRLKLLLEQMSSKPGASIPFACQDWANTKAAYRFLSNPRVDEARILKGHFDATKRRFDALSVDDQHGPVLILHDTTEVSYRREDPSRVGLIGKLDQYTQCGVMLHSSLVITTEGLPLGIAASKFWTRQEFKGTNALSRSINPTRIPIEQKESYRWLENMRQSTQLLAAPHRCVHIGDRESDIYELFCEAKQHGTHFLVRTVVNRLAGAKGQTVNSHIANLKPSGRHTVHFVDKHGVAQTALLELYFTTLTLHPPIGKQNRYSDLELTILHAKEITATKGRAPIHWKLITDLPVSTPAQAAQMLAWYALRWKIEVFHKVLKSGCKVQDSKLRSAHPLSNMLALKCIIGWRIFWLTMLARSNPSAQPNAVFTAEEIKALDYIAAKNTGTALPDYLIKLAQLGGYLARKQDPPPGNQVMWRGMQRLNDIVLGMQLRDQLCG